MEIVPEVSLRKGLIEWTSVRDQCEISAETEMNGVISLVPQAEVLNDGYLQLFS